jgi:hypothetical protein
MNKRSVFLGHRARIVGGKQGHNMAGANDDEERGERKRVGARLI